jgi:hypothetical protein
MEGNERQKKSYYKSAEHPAPESVKVIKKSKFPGKVLVWLFSSSVIITKCLPVSDKFIKNYPRERVVILEILNGKNVVDAILDSAAILNFYDWKHYFSAQNL